MEIIEETRERLCMASHPSLLSQAVAVGFFSFGVALSICSESIFWQFLFILGGLLIASSFYGHWQNLVIDKVAKTLHFDVQNVYQKVFLKDKYITSETLDLKEMKQIRVNPHNGTVSFYHNQSTISIYIGSQSECETMSDKFKSLLPVSMPACQETERESSEGGVQEKASHPRNERGADTAAGTVPKLQQDETGAKGEGENISAGPTDPSSNSCELTKDDDSHSSDESFEKIDDNEMEEFREPHHVPTYERTTLYEAEFASAEDLVATTRLPEHEDLAATMRPPEHEDLAATMRPPEHEDLATTMRPPEPDDPATTMI